MKKIFALILMVSLLAAISIVGAQEDSLDKVAVMETKEGAYIRLMQLQGALEQNIARGQLVAVSVVEEKPDADAERMVSIIAELKLLGEEVAELLEAASSDVDGSEIADIAKRFVIIKEEAAELTHEFRENAGAMIAAENRERIREQVRNEQNPEVEELRAQIQERIKEHNALQVQRFAERIGLDDTQLADRVRAGELNVGEAISSLAVQYRGLNQEGRTEALANAKEERSRAQVHMQAVRADTANIAQEFDQRAQERAQVANGKVEQVRQRINDMLEQRAIDRGEIAEQIPEINYKRGGQ